MLSCHNRRQLLYIPIIDKNNWIYFYIEHNNKNIYHTVITGIHNNLNLLEY